MNKYLLFLLIFFSFHFIYAQDEESLPAGDMPAHMITRSGIYGKVVDKKTNKGIESASVQLFAVLPANQGKDKKDSLISAMLTRQNGDFGFENLPSFSKFIIVITYTGYESVMKETGNAGEKKFRMNTGIDLGNILLTPAVKELGMVTVVAQKPALVIGIDKKIFHVDKSIVSTGGTGIDVMKNIPSVSVDVDGNVLLRNSPPQIFVDGRPTILTIDQIPADDIDRVELITNPSAKYDASGGAGIVNIILKKNKRRGLNGLVSAGVGYPGLVNGNANVNLRQGKFNYFFTGSYNRAGGIANSRVLRENKKGDSIENYFNQNSDNDMLRRFGSVRFGLDFFADNRNTISITQQMVKGDRDNYQTQDQEYLNSNRRLIYAGNRLSDDEFNFRRNNTQLNYIHNFPEAGKEFTANISYSYGNGGSRSHIKNSYSNPDGTEYSDDAMIMNLGNGQNKQLTIQADYSNEIKENVKIETGARTFVNHFRSEYNSYDVSNGYEVKLPLSNNYKYREMVNAIYFTYTGKLRKLGYQLGLRTEYSRFDGELIDSSKKFGYEYPDQLKNLWDALFPSVYLTRDINDKTQVQVNYSRRIRRPNFWQLNPFVDINDPVNLRVGNPGLQPEFINSFEFNYSKDFGKGNNFLGVIYFRNNPGDITRYSDTISADLYQRLNNAAIDPNAIVNTFINAQVTNRIGAELTLQKKFGKAMDITPTINMQYRKVDAGNKNPGLSNEGFNWEAKLIVNFRAMPEKRSLFKDFSMQAIGNYESPEVIPQGRRIAQYHLDLAFRKDLLKDRKANITFSINDVFNSRRYGAIYNTDNYYQDSYWRRSVRGFRLVFSWKFGDSNFSFRKTRERDFSDE